MQKTKILFAPLVLAALLLWAAVPAAGHATDRDGADRPDRPQRPDRTERPAVRNEATQQNTNHSRKSGGPLCTVFSSHPFFAWLTPFSWCSADEPPTPPPPPAPPEPDTFSISGMKWNDENGNGVQDEDEQGLESWTVTADNASGTLSVSTTTSPDGSYSFTAVPTNTYTVCEEQQEGWTQTFPVNNEGCHEIVLDDSGVLNVDFGNKQDQEPEPEPSADHLLISEVYYDVDDTHGTEAFNEWIEIYNGTGVTVDLTDWSIEDATSNDLLPGAVMLPTGMFAIITRDDTTAPFWAWPAETAVILVDAPLGNGLGNAGDVLYLQDSQGDVVDSVNWGTSVEAFDPSVPGVAEGMSIARQDLAVDTDTAADWVQQDTPNPGE